MTTRPLRIALDAMGGDLGPGEVIRGAVSAARGRKEDLHIMRQAIDSYTVDKQKAPQSLDDLVQSGYLKVMPTDPFTHRSDTWMPVQADTLQSLDQTESGIDDVHSGSQETAIDGTAYNTW